MAGKKAVELSGKPAYVGRAFDQLPELRKGAVPVLNTSEDFAIWALPDTADVTVLELADHPQADQGPVSVRSAHGGRGGGFIANREQCATRRHGQATGPDPQLAARRPAAAVGSGVHGL
jgi:hypothetical protein